MFAFLPVTPERGDDLERFSSRHGKFRYCSCMRWRMTGAEFKASDKEARVAALAASAEAGEPVGVLAYEDGEPVGWCAVAPREGLRGLERYRALARIDETPVWSVVCLFVDASVRRRGLTSGLLRAAARYAVAAGARVVEGYPVEPDAKLYTYMGSPAAFTAAGFHDVTPPGRERRVFRYLARSGGGADAFTPRTGGPWR
jgi:GNAT superfamily N-acetyltransferase